MRENPLTHSRVVLGKWLPRLSSVSALLYEKDSSAWSVFEPARRKLEETLAWLHAEGTIDLDNETVGQAAQKAPKYFERIAWSRAAETAKNSLGITELEAAVESDA